MKSTNETMMNPRRVVWSIGLLLLLGITNFVLSPKQFQLFTQQQVCSPIFFFFFCAEKPQALPRQWRGYSWQQQQQEMVVV
jgi:hypothetical protein